MSNRSQILSPCPLQIQPNGSGSHDIVSIFGIRSQQESIAHLWISQNNEFTNKFIAMELSRTISCINLWFHALRWHRCAPVETWGIWTAKHEMSKAKVPLYIFTGSYCYYSSIANLNNNNEAHTLWERQNCNRTMIVCLLHTYSIFFYICIPCLVRGGTTYYTS